MESMDVIKLNAQVKAQVFQHPLHILQAALCIASSAFVSIGTIVWMLT